MKSVEDLQWDCLKHLRLYWQQHEWTPFEKENLIRHFLQSNPFLVGDPILRRIIKRLLFRIQIRLVTGSRPLSPMQQFLINPLLTETEQIALSRLKVPRQESEVKFRNELRNRLEQVAQQDGKQLDSVVYNIATKPKILKQLLIDDFQVSTWQDLPLFTHLLEKVFASEDQRELIRRNASRWLKKWSSIHLGEAKKFYPSPLQQVRPLPMEVICHESSPYLTMLSTDDDNLKMEKEELADFCQDYRKLACLREITPKVMYAPGSLAYLSNAKEFAKLAAMQQQAKWTRKQEIS